MLDGNAVAAAGSTSQTRGLRSAAAWIASAAPHLRETFLDGLGPNALASLPWLFEFWALEHQLPPQGDWRSWVVLGGRGAGKTRAGAEWVRAQVEGAGPRDPGRAARIALIGETYEQVRDVMIEGESGLLACSPPDRRPVWKASQRKLIWPSGAVAHAVSASDPEALRGPQFDAAWADELAKWKRADETWDMLQFALRLGDAPRAVVTTTPRNTALLKELVDRGSTVCTHATTETNRANLARGFLAEVTRRYGGTRLGRQELEGVLLEETEGALWSRRALDAARIGAAPDLDRIVVGVDPSASGGDETGIVVVGCRQAGPVENWTACVLEDATVAGPPAVWAAAVAEASRRWGADRVVAEANQGGDMIETVLRVAAPEISYRKVHASRGKAARAEPVAALYERGRVRHLGGLGALEDQMCAMTVGGFEGRGSPDRVDALVWALWATLLDPALRRPAPAIRMV